MRELAGTVETPGAPETHEFATKPSSARSNGRGDTSYLLGSSDAELEHLTRQAEDWSPDAEWLLDAVGVRAGWRVIDVACGALGILQLLANRVGPTGAVFGVDREPRMLETARNLALRRGLSITLAQTDAEAMHLPRAWFDLAHARALLVNVPDPECIVREMAAIVRPGGIVALQEPDSAAWTCDPPHPSWDRLLRMFQTTYGAHGQDTFVGRRLPSLLRQAGLEDVVGRMHTRLTHAGEYYQTFLLTLVTLIRDRMLACRLVGERELQELIASLRTHLEQPTTVTSGPPIWQVWARKPLSGS
jgi:SAM-dependent methyltransferase